MLFALLSILLFMFCSPSSSPLDVFHLSNAIFSYQEAPEFLLYISHLLKLPNLFLAFLAHPHSVANISLLILRCFCQLNLKLIPFCLLHVPLSNPSTFSSCSIHICYTQQLNILQVFLCSFPAAVV